MMATSVATQELKQSANWRQKYNKHKNWTNNIVENTKNTTVYQQQLVKVVGAAVATGIVYCSTEIEQ